MQPWHQATLAQPLQCDLHTLNCETQRTTRNRQRRKLQLQNRILHKALPSTTLYYKACIQYYFVLQSLHKALPSTTLYYKACTKHFPVLLCITKLAQRKLLHTSSSFAEKLLHTASFLNREAFTHRRFYTQQALHREAFTHSKLLHTASVYTQNAFTQSACFYTWQALTRSEAFTQRSFYTHREAFTHSKLSTHKIFYTQQAFTEKKITQKSFLVHNDNRNCSSKTGWISHQSKKHTILKHFLKGILQRKLLAPRLKNLLTNHCRSLDAATPSQ